MKYHKSIIVSICLSMCFSIQGNTEEYTNQHIGDIVFDIPSSAFIIEESEGNIISKEYNCGEYSVKILYMDSEFTSNMNYDNKLELLACLLDIYDFNTTTYETEIQYNDDFYGNPLHVRSCKFLNNGNEWLVIERAFYSTKGITLFMYGGELDNLAVHSDTIKHIRDSIHISNTDNATDQYLTVNNQNANSEFHSETYCSQEITFRDIPWGTNYTDTCSLLSEFNIWNLSGEYMKTYSIDDIALGDYQGIVFENSDINIVGNAFNGEIDVAGYKTSAINLYFAYLPVDGVLLKTEDSSSLYGAQYTFKPNDLSGMSQDLIEKLSALYGAFSDVKEFNDIWGNKTTCTFWNGANDTMVVLRTFDTTNDTTGLYNDKIYISYIWKHGDELLQIASDTLKQNKIDNEASVYGNSSTNGL